MAPSEICLTGRRIDYSVNIARSQGDREMARLFPSPRRPTKTVKHGFERSQALGGAALAGESASGR